MMAEVIRRPLRLSSLKPRFCNSGQSLAQSDNRLMVCWRHTRIIDMSTTPISSAALKAMSDDERLAWELQRQFDAEEHQRQAEEAASERLAQQLAASSHAMSDSEESDSDSKVVQTGSKQGLGLGKRHHSPQVSVGTSDQGGAPSKDRSEPAGKRRKLPPTITGARTAMSPSTASRRSSVVTGQLTPGAQTKLAAQTNKGAKKPDTDTAPARGGQQPSLRECQYGARCYRLGNPAHTQAFSHPEQPSGQPQRKGDTVNSSFGSANGLAAEKKRPDRKTTIADRLREAEPMSLFLSKVRSVKSTWRERLSLGIVELLDPSLGDLRSSLQLNFMVDLEWLTEAYSVYGHQHKPLTVLHGRDLVSSPQSNVTVQKVSMPFPFGTHHTKMMLFEYTEGLRVVIHTANLVDDDWRNKTQGLWVSPLLPPLAGDVADDAGEAPTGFRADLGRYLSAYKLRCLAPWVDRVGRHDFSAIRAFFVGSVPGRYQGSEMARWGHFRVRRLLQKHAIRRSWELVIQCSSIGRMGQLAEDWMLGEFRESLTGGPSSARAAVIYPTEENVRNSVEGYQGGSCLPYMHSAHVGQLWLQNHLHQWRSDSRNRTGAMPHIKTYTQLAGDGQRLGWFLLTSANLSKAAWGALEKQGQQLFIRSYEAGVLYLPKLLDRDVLTVLTGDTAVAGCVSLPYSLPLAPYQDDDKPWFSDTAHQRQDAFGGTVAPLRSRRQK